MLDHPSLFKRSLKFWSINTFVLREIVAFNWNLMAVLLQVLPGLIHHAVGNIDYLYLFGSNASFNRSFPKILLKVTVMFGGDQNLSTISRLNPEDNRIRLFNKVLLSSCNLLY